MSTSCFDREDETFIVLVNHEDQYSIWPHWKAVLEYVEKTWSDMRPKSLRDWMAQQEHTAAAG